MPSSPAPTRYIIRPVAKISSWFKNVHGGRTLIAEILSLQVVLTAIVGIGAIAGMYWMSQNILLENVDRWANQWVNEIEELGSPLYLASHADAFVAVERYAQSYPEIGRVTYFDTDGHVIDSIRAGTSSNTARMLLPVEMEELNARIGDDAAHVMLGGDVQGQFFIRSAIWSESIVGDGLFSLDQEEIESEITQLGFVELYLDFTPYFDKIAANVQLASLALLALLLVIALLSHHMLRRSLRSLSDLKRPISELAQGKLEVDFPTTPHGEIAAIVDALKTTVSTLRQRNSKLTRLANHDALTGLFNRHRFFDELRREIANVEREEITSALFFIDLDQFKYVNDTCGHPAGDKLLVCAARQLSLALRKHDSISRFGGDEFAILVCDVSRREAKAIAENILEQMRDFAHVENGHVFHLQCSIGVTMIVSDKLTADEVVSQADIACHEAKQRGRNRLEFYRVSAKETEQMKEDVGWTQRIKLGLAEDMFVLRFQPIVHIPTGMTSHHEVLLRLQLADGRIVSPNVFLPAAERFGLMNDIDLWVLEHAIEALSIHRRENSGLKFTINLSAHAFEIPDLHKRIRDLLSLNNVPANAIVIEITEQVAIRNVSQVEKQLLSLKSLGCKVAIDDFGTGYSSFSHLKRFKFDYLKIDGSFVEDLARDPVDQTMVRLFADIGKGLGVPTIAEFVTDATSYALLAKFGIDYAQGFHVGRPLPVPRSPSFAIPFEVSRRNRKTSTADTK